MAYGRCAWDGTSALRPTLQLAMDNGTKRALIPLENKRSFLEVTGDVVEHVDPIFFGDPKTAAFKARAQLILLDGSRALERGFGGNARKAAVKPGPSDPGGPQRHPIRRLACSARAHLQILSFLIGN
jgi:hypothetical protein